ncbi:MAG: hypothetical protein PHV06_05670 [bacterium]|nr:hypothetical protein [bacterium]
MLAILFGIIAIVGGVLLLALTDPNTWWQAFKDVVQGSIPPFLVFIGFISIFIGIGNIKDKIAEKKEREEEEKEMKEAEKEKKSE